MSDCLFCKMAHHEMIVPMLYEDDSVFIIRDIHPQAPVHLLAIPKKHFSAIHSVPATESALFSDLFHVIGNYLSAQKIDTEGYRTVINAGTSAGQSIFHLHVHILSGRQLSNHLG